MKNRHYIHPATLFFVLSVVVVLLSWIGNIYGWEGVRNLLSAEGLRWKLRTVGDTFLNVPFLGDMMILFLGGGLAVHSGWSAASLKLLKKRSQLSRRELKAWLMGTVCGIIILLLWGILAWGPWGGLRSISGGMSDSPLQEGSACILSAILGITGLVYGYAVDFYHSDKDIVRGMAFGFIRFPEFFVTLFFRGTVFRGPGIYPSDAMSGHTDRNHENHLCFVHSSFVKLCVRQKKVYLCAH